MDMFFNVIWEWALREAAGVMLGATVVAVIAWVIRTRDFRQLGGEISSLSQQLSTQKKDFSRQVDALREQVANARFEQIHTLILAATNGRQEFKKSDKINESEESITYRQMWEASPGSGRAAAHLIMTVDKLDEARAIYDAHRASPKIESPNWANYAMITRLDFDGLYDESLALSFDRSGEPDELSISEKMVEELSNLYKQLKERSHG